jgi:hypothetical protein
MSKNTSDVLVLNVTAKGIVVRFESLRSENSELCFLSPTRADALGITVPTDVKSCWLQRSNASRKAEGAWAKYQLEGTQRLPLDLTTFPLFMQGEKWLVEDRDLGTPAEKQWQGLKLAE